MKVISLQSALQTVMLAIVFASAGRAEDGGSATSSKQDLQAKIEYCKECHGLSGQGYRGFFTMPRLAGQTTEYLENQLRAFVEHRRDKDIFIDMAKVHGLSPATRMALATHFRELNSAPLEGAPKNLVATGKTIYEAGLPEANVPACIACHGPEAKGQDQIPRLAGQLFPYTAKELTNWNKERRQSPAKDDTSAIMAPIAHNLTQSQIASIAAYLSYLK